MLQGNKYFLAAFLVFSEKKQKREPENPALKPYIFWFIIEGKYKIIYVGCFNLKYYPHRQQSTIMIIVINKENHSQKKEGKSDKI